MEHLSHHPCKCCGTPADNELLPICCNIEELYHLGPTLPLFLHFIKSSIFILCIFFSFCSIYSLWNYSQSNLCFVSETLIDECPDDIILRYSAANYNNFKDDTIDTIQEFILFLTICCLMVFIEIILIQNKKIIARIDLQNDTPADYAIRLIGIPRKCQNLHQKLKKLFEDKGYSINKLIIVHDIKEYVYLMRKIKFIKKILQSQKHSSLFFSLMISCLYSKNYYHSIQKQLESCEKKLKEFNGNHILEHNCGTCFIIFNTQAEVNTILNQYHRKWIDRALIMFKKYNIENQLQLDGQALFVKTAFEPSDLLWENLNITWKERIYRQIITAIIAILLLSINFIVLWTLLAFEKEYESHFGDIDDLITYVIPSTIFIVNSLFQVTINTLKSLEKPESYTYYILSLIKDEAKLKFVNSTIVSLAFALHLKNIFSEDGVLYLCFNIMVSTAFVGPIFNSIIDSQYISWYIKKFFIEWKKDKLQMTQHDLNTLYEYPEFDLPSAYSMVLLIVWLGGAFAPILPLAPLIGIIGLIVLYWGQKYSILRRRTLPKNMNGVLAFKISAQLKKALLLYTIFHYFFYWYVLGNIADFGLFTYLALIIAIIYCIMPTSWITKRFSSKYLDKTNTLKYDEVKDKFISDYDKYNPVNGLKQEDGLQDAKDVLGNIAEYALEIDLVDAVENSRTKGLGKRKLKDILMKYKLISKFIKLRSLTGTKGDKNTSFMAMDSGNIRTGLMKSDIEINNTSYR